MTIAIFLLFTSPIFSLGSDPLVAHAFQWALYGSQLERAVVPEKTGQISEGIRIRARDGFALLKYPLVNNERFDLALVGLRNLLAASWVGDKNSMDLAAKMSTTTPKVVEAVVKALERIKTSAVAHTHLVFRNIDQLSLRERLVIRTGLVQLNILILGINSTTSAFRSRKQFPLLLKACFDLKAAVASISLLNLRRLASPLNTAIRDLVRILHKVKALEMCIYDHRPAKKQVDMTELDQFLRSPEYSKLAAIMKTDVQPVQAAVTRDLINDLFRFRCVDDLREMVSTLSDPISGYQSAMLESLGQVAQLWKEDRSELMNISQSVCGLRVIMARVFALNGGDGEDLELTRDAVRAEFYGTLVVFLSRVVGQLNEVLEMDPKMDAAMEAVHAVQNFFAVILRNTQSRRVNEAWLFHGDAALHKLWIEASIELLNASLAVKMNLPQLSLTEVLNAMNAVDALATEVQF